MSQPFALNFPPGLQRDGTTLDSDGYLVALWCRFRLKRPRKIGGYKTLTDQVSGLPRRIHMFYRGDRTFIHVGTVNGIQQFVVDRFGTLVSMADRTPVGFAAGVSIGFTMDAIFDTTSSVVQLVVHSVPDAGDVASSLTTVPFLGQIDSPTPLVQFGSPGALSGGAVWTQPDLAGGIVCVQPFVFGFDNSGRVLWKIGRAHV